MLRIYKRFVAVLFWTGTTCAVLSGCRSSSLGRESESTDTSSEVVTDTEVICYDGETRCAPEGRLERCDNGSWIVQEDCAAQGEICTMMHGERGCYDISSADAGSDTDSVTLADAGTDTGTETDSTDHSSTGAGADSDTSTASATDAESCGTDNPCGEHGSCEKTPLGIVCTCDRGWAGAHCDRCAAGFHPENGSCVLDHTCLPTSCAGHGTCDVVEGQVTCTCTVGANWDPQSYCAECMTGYHPDGDVCVIDEICGVDDSPCVNGACDVVGGRVVCFCTGLWTGDRCDACPAGHHESLDGGSCLLDETCLPATCAGHGTCEVQDGVVRCICTEDANWDPDTYCAACVDGYHPDGDVCVQNEICGVHDEPCVNGTCAVVEGRVTCTCQGLWQGAVCDACPIGYHVEGTDCVENKHCENPQDNTCENGTCSDLGGIIDCTCDSGWGGADCDECAAGYHLVIDVCELDETCLPTSCAGHGDCTINAYGYVACDCDAGGHWDPAVYCAECLPGYHVDNGVCVPDRSCAEDNDCVNGTCVDNLAGTDFTCSCDPYWEGEICDSCIEGFQDDNDDGICRPDCGYPGSPDCQNGGICVINLLPQSTNYGYAVCNCAPATPWFGTLCDQCPNAICGGVCCSAGQSCHETNDTCCTPSTCDTFPGAPECGESGTLDACGRPVDCGDCGSYGYCLGGACQCLQEYGVPAGEHECVHACDGYLPAVGCCDNEVVYYCSGGTLRNVDCYGEYYDLGAPWWSCGYVNAAHGGPDFNCGGTDSVEPGYVAACPGNIVPECTGDSAEPNDTAGAAEAIAFEVIETQLRICPGDDDWFVLTGLNVGDEITVILEFLHAAGNLDLYLTDASSTVLAASESFSNSESVAYTIAQSGNYFIHVKGFSGTVMNGYTLLAGGTLTCVNDAFDTDGTNNDVPAQADSLTSGVLVEDVVICSGETIGDVDWYSLPAAAPGDTVGAAISFQHNAGNLDLYFYDDPAGAPLVSAQSLTDNETVLFVADATHNGTFYLKVEGANAAVRNSYGIVASVGACTDPYEVNDSAAQARSAPVGDVLENGFVCAGDVDWFRISGEVRHGQTIQLDATFDTAGDLDLALYYDNGGAVQHVADGVPGADGESLTFSAGDTGATGLTSTGTYYFTLAESYPGSGQNDYAVDIDVSGSCGDRLETHVGIDDYPYPDNDTDEHAVILVSGQTEGGLYICPEDYDFFVLQDVEAGSGISVAITFDDSPHSASGTTDLDLFLWVTAYDPVSWSTFVDASYSNTSNEAISVTAPQTADYYILVSGDEYGDVDFSKQENMYGISVTVTPP